MASQTCGGGSSTRITYATARLCALPGARKRPFLDMLTLTLPDGSERSVAEGALPIEVVKSIGERLAQAAIAVQVDDDIQDLMTPLRKSGRFRVLTAKDRLALDVLRHSAAHVLATAVRR